MVAGFGLDRIGELGSIEIGNGFARRATVYSPPKRLGFWGVIRGWGTISDLIGSSPPYPRSHTLSIEKSKDLTAIRLKKCS